MVNRYNEIAEKMPWIKKKDNPRNPWEAAQHDESEKQTTSGILASKENVITKIKNLQSRLNELEDEKQSLSGDLERVRKEISNKDTIISEKDNAINEVKEQLYNLEKAKDTWETKVNDLTKALKTSTSEKLYLEQELAAADKALSEINALLAS